MQVEEAEGIYNSLSEPEKRQALQFLRSVVGRYHSSVKLDASTASESCKTTESGELGDGIQAFTLLLEKQITKLEEKLEKPVCDVEQCLSVEPAGESNANSEQKRQHTSDKFCLDASSCQKMYSEQQTAVGYGSYRSSVIENTDNGEKLSDSLQHLSPNRRKRTLKRIYSSFYSGEKSEIGRLERSGRKPIDRCKIERRQPITLLVKTAYKQRLAENGDAACLGKDGRKKNFSCLLCDDKFSQETPYLQHLVFVHRSNPCCCRFCHQLLTSAQSNQTHNLLCSKSNRLQTLNSRETSRNLLDPNLISSGTENQTHVVENNSSQEILETQSKNSSYSRSRLAGQFHRQVHTGESR